MPLIHIKIIISHLLIELQQFSMNFHIENVDFVFLFTIYNSYRFVIFFIDTFNIGVICIPQLNIHQLSTTAASYIQNHNTTTQSRILLVNNKQNSHKLFHAYRRLYIVYSFRNCKISTTYEQKLFQNKLYVFLNRIPYLSIKMSTEVFLSQSWCTSPVICFGLV